MFRLPVSTPASHFLALRRRTRSWKFLFRLIVAVERYLEPEGFAVNSDGSSDSTFSDDDAVPSVEVPEPAPESADAELLEEAGASSASPRVRWARAVAEYEEQWKDLQASKEAMEARTRHN
eukprot:1306569-Pleurochrysis_carterae.AAC.1